MNKYLAKAAGRVAPRTMENIKTLNTLDKEYEDGPARFVSYERELRNLRREIDELRRDNRRVAELYDIVFEWAKAHAAEGDDVFDGTVETLGRHQRSAGDGTGALDLTDTPLEAVSAAHGSVGAAPVRARSIEAELDDDADDDRVEDSVEDRG